MKKLLLISGLLSALVAQTAFAAPPTRYNFAIRDAAIPEASELVPNLDVISPDNNSLVWNADKTLIKVVTWKSQSSYQNYILPKTQTEINENFVIWVTLAPKMHEFCHHYLSSHRRATAANLDYRLKQRLGLNSDGQYDVFVEMWVSPNDIFRPCVDPETNDASCNLNFGATIPTVKNIKDYGVFYKNLYFNSFRNASVPWTGLGYTYDWKFASKASGAAEQGASEFILVPGANYVIEQATPTWQYCAQ